MRLTHAFAAALSSIAPLASLAGCDVKLLFPIEPPAEPAVEAASEPPGAPEAPGARGAPGETCETVPAAESDVTPQVLLVLDRSGSMNDGAPGFTGTRWSAVAGAVTSMTAAHETRVSFGLMLFPSPSSADECAAGDVVLEPAPANARDVADAVADTAPRGKTPTASSLRAARQYLEGRDGGAPAAVILATDGGPTCNAALDVDTCGCVAPGACDGNLAPAEDICLDDTETVAAAEELHEAGVSTYVIGIPGSEDFAHVLDEIAMAGGTARSPDAGPERYYPTTDAASLASALEAVPARLEKCRRVVQLDEGRTLREAESIAVALDGEPIARDPQRVEGWEVTGTNRIELFGAACDGAVAGAPVDVTVCHVLGDDVTDA